MVAALLARFRLGLFVFWTVCGAASDPQQRHWGDDKDASLPQDAAQDFRRTYVHNNRRYGQPNWQPNYGQPNYGQPNYGYGANGQPNYGYNGPYDYHNGFPIGVDGAGFDQAGIQLPGILGGWRSDLQGRQRPDSPKQEVDRDVIVTTSYGQVQGFRVNLYDNPLPESGFRPGQSPVERIQAQLTAFLGIPYALPPVNEGRFKPPRAHPGWQMVQAVDFGPACPQPAKYTGATKGVRDMHEDCLYLNIFTPSTNSGLAQRYPVIVYIHGGEFYKGASNLFPGHVMAAFYNVVVVTFNYRLGALGFLSTGDENSPGNYGILDQAMALRWIYDNIQFFNGDRDSITLLGGAGAGAASAGLLMLNPRTKHIVTRVIAQSGSALADWALILDHYRAQNTSRVFAQQLGCSIESSYKIVDCLRRGRNLYELGNAEFQPEVGTFPWGPVLDKGFTVPGDNWFEGWKQEDWFFTNFTPEVQIKNRQFNSGLSYLTGVTTQEAAFIIYNNETLSPFFDVDEQWFDQKIKELVLRYNYTLNPDGIYRAIKYRYTYWPDPKNTTHIREQFIDMMSDFLYRAPTDHMIKLLVEQNVPVYSYVLNTTIEALKLQQWRKYPHNIEHLLLVGAPFLDPEFFPSKTRLDKFMWTDNDRNMSHFFMKAYTDFARFGNPSHTQILGLHFEMAKPGDLRYLNLNTTFNSSIMINYRQTESAFWTWYLPTVIGILVPTYPPSTEYWWEPKEPLQIAFWTVSGTNLLLIVLVVIFCILWRNAKRQKDRYYSSDILMMREEPERGIENKSESAGNIYEYRDTPTPSEMKKFEPRKSVSSPSLRIGGSNSSLKDSGLVSSSPNGEPRRSRTPPVRRSLPRKTVTSGGVPMTDV